MYVIFYTPLPSIMYLLNIIYNKIFLIIYCPPLPMSSGSQLLLLSCVPLFVTSWTVAHQAPLSGFSRQEYWSGLPFPSPGDLPNLGIEPRSLCYRQNFYYLSHHRSVLLI